MQISMVNLVLGVCQLTNIMTLITILGQCKFSKPIKNAGEL